MYLVLLLLFVGSVAPLNNFDTVCQYTKTRLEKQNQPEKKDLFFDVLTSVGIKGPGDTRGKERRNDNNLTDQEKGQSASDIYYYSKDIEHLVNLQINNELRASYAYMMAAFQFEQDTRDFPGMAKFFHKASEEELSHAKMFMKYQVTRGGSLTGYPIKSSTMEYGSLAQAIDWALKLEQAVTKELHCLDTYGTSLDDAHFVDFIESKMLPEQYESMKLLSSYNKTLAKISRGLSLGLAEYQFDMITLQGNQKKGEL